MQTFIAQHFSSGTYQLAESPFYDYRTKTLSWVDIPAGKFYTSGNDGTDAVKFYCFGQPTGAAVPAEKEGVYVVAAADGLYLYEKETVRLLNNLSEYYKSYQRSNDAKADSAGRLWFGSVVNDDEHEASGNLFCLDGGNIFCRQKDTKISNGMAWSSDLKKFYFSDSLCHAVFSYDYDAATGNISNRTVLFTVQTGLPDGMCIDAEDNLWVAIWGGNRIEKRSSKDGILLATVSVDSKNVTSCCFFGSKLDTLFITASDRLFTCKVDCIGKHCDVAKVFSYITVNQTEYKIISLLGKGKGGYSYLAEDDDGKKYVVKQIHHEPCSYYHFGNKIEAEQNDYKRLCDAGIRIPKMISIDVQQERIVKEYIEGKTIFDLVKDDSMKDMYVDQVRAMAAQAKSAGLNIDYFPTNFVVSENSGTAGTLFYIDYECNNYMDEWNFENWGIKYWSKTPEFMEYVQKNKAE